VFARYEPEALHPCRYRGPAAGRLAAVAHARLAARRYYATRWLGTPRSRRLGTMRRAANEWNGKTFFDQDSPNISPI